MKRNSHWNGFRAKAAVLLVLALLLQNASFALAEISGDLSANEASGDAVNEHVLESANTSFVSFPSRFSDILPEGYQEQYYSFELDSVTDISISVESDDSSCQYGAELLDSGFSSLGISKRKTGQRITKKKLPAGTYFLRVFPLSDEAYAPYYVSLQKLKLSASEVKATDFSEMHMVATLQGSDSPYKLNGLDPYYEYDYLLASNSVAPKNYQWYRLDEPEYSDSGVNYGGLYPLPQSYYASWLGPVAESEQPMSAVRPKAEAESYDEYNRYLQEEGITYREAEPQIHVQNSIALPKRYLGIDDGGNLVENPGWEAHIKAGIMNYGALTTGICSSYLPCEDGKDIYYCGWNYNLDRYPNLNYIDYTFPSYQYQNHEIVVVGWDDNYPRENFRYKPYKDLDGVVINGNVYKATSSDAARGTAEEVLADAELDLSAASRASSSVAGVKAAKTDGNEADAEKWINIDELFDSLIPEEDGAWIIRNSWGTGAGEDGYYYVSYCDTQLFGHDNTWAYTATETTGNYNKLYELTSLPYTKSAYWTTGEDMVMASTVFTADEDGADVLKAVNFALLNNNIRYEIAVNLGDDIGKGWIDDNVYAKGSKLYAGYYTVRLDKAVLLEPGEPFEVILKIMGDGPSIELPLVANDSYVANIPQEEGICRLYDPELGEKWIDIGKAFVEGNGSSNYYGYFAVKALCNDASLEEGETERVTMLDIDPDNYISRLEDYLKEHPEYEAPEEDGTEAEAEAEGTQDNEAEGPKASEGSEAASAHKVVTKVVSSKKASPSDAEKRERKEAEDAADSLRLVSSHVLMKRDTSDIIQDSELSEPSMIFPESFDLREEGVLTPIRNQESTNTCWSFGSTAAVESSYLLNGSNLYDFNYSSGISLETKLPITEEGTVIYRFDKADDESLDDALFTPKLLSWDNGPIEDAYGQLRWELSGDLSAVDVSNLDDETGGTELTENGDEVLLFTPKESGLLTVKVSSADDPTKTAACRVMLLEEDPVGSITVSPERLSLRAGQSRKLEVKIEKPEGSGAKPVFSSDNPNIATVNEEGLVLGVSGGTTVIRVRAGGEEASCTVTVWRESSSGGNAGSKVVYSGSQSQAGSPVRGSWSQKADGSWSFTSGGHIYKNEWGYIYNPYGADGKGEAAWFRFGESNQMLTGWFEDTDGSWYYLSTVSDGGLGRMMTGWLQDTDGHMYYLNPAFGSEMGRMLTGWQWISDENGKRYCFYFYPEAGGPKGAMALSCITPDGYQLDDKGRWCVNGVPQIR